MTGILRLALLVLGLAALTLLPLAFVGDGLPEVSLEEATARLRGFGAWAWAVGIGLLVADLVLPVPSIAVIAGLGAIYGPLLGGLVGAVGSFLAGMAAYGLARTVGPRTAARLAGANGLARSRALFERWGAPLVALSRWVPVLPETVALLAGLTRMPAGRFAAALALGTAPLGLTFATIGHLGTAAPVAAIVAAAVLPVAIWAVVRRQLRRRRERRAAANAPPRPETDRRSAGRALPGNGW